MLGNDVAKVLSAADRPFIATDVEIDITDPSQIRRFLDRQKGAGLEWIVNCAAYTAVDRAEDEPAKAEAINAAAVRFLGEAARERGAAVVHISTDYVFNGGKEGAYVETDEPDPIGSYGRTKLAGEQALRKALDEHCILRTSWLFGRHGANFVHTMLRLFSEKEAISVVNDQWGSPTYAADLARAIAAVIDAGRRSYGTYHFSNEGRTNWHQFACEIYRQASEMGIITRTVAIRPIRSDEYPTRAKRPANSYMSKEKFRSTFGFAIRPWEEALAAFLEEHRHAQAA